MRVLVLTDYYPLKLLLGQMSVLIGQEWLALRARHLVKHDAARPGIEALAKALIERRELSGTEACKVIVEASAVAHPCLWLSILQLLFPNIPRRNCGNDYMGVSLGVSSLLSRTGKSVLTPAASVSVATR